MINFKQDNNRFNYRTVGIAINQDRVLIHRAEHDNFWTLPGGRVELGESAHNALIREFYEELKVSISINRLLWVVENFFEYNNENYHELAFYFLVNIPDKSEILEKDSFIGYEENIQLIFQWYPIKSLNDLLLYPTFLQNSLSALPTSTEYIIHRD